MSKVAQNLQAFQIAVNAHDRENECTAWGIGLAAFDMGRLDLDEGEMILPGIELRTWNVTAGNFRVLCDGEHDENGRFVGVAQETVETSQPVKLRADPEWEARMWAFFYGLK